VQLIGASKSAVLATTEPVTTISLAAVILYEPVMPIQMFGGALILISVVLLALLRK
jgi:drug/metabolite transporter (DMT)-like permease